MAYRALMTSQTNAIFKAVREAGFPKSEFGWATAKPERYSSEVPRLVHKPTGYYFLFDYHEADLRDPSTRVARYSPGRDHEREYSTCKSWNGMLAHVEYWLGYIKRETEEPDLWSEEDYKNLNNWALSNSKFNKDELNHIHKGLERVKQLLIGHSNKTEKSLADINENILYLKKAAEKSGRRDWLMMFIGVFVSKFAEWGITDLPWRSLVVALLKELKDFLLGEG